MMTGFQDMTGLADALGDVRGQIRALREREAQLRQAILDARPNGTVEGGQYVVELRQQTRRRFDPKFLPDHIRNDPRYWTVTSSAAVITRALAAEDDIDVVEPF